VKESAYKNYTEPELIAMCLRGDGGAWEALIVRHRRLIYSIPIRFGFSNADASDVFQAVCVKLLENLQGLKDDRKLTVWLATTTTHECMALKRLRDRESGAEEDIEEPLDPTESIEDVRLYSERLQAMRGALDQLPDRCKSLIEALYLDARQPSYERISKQFGIPESSIGPTRARCLDKLRWVLRRSNLFKK
jgi:RNA polymerase sigma factor (sigma-70 family)